jgi:26S proteasome regulatory subunit N3
MPGKTPDKEPVENGGYRGGKDIENKDLKHKGKKSVKEGDDEMTVVVPPSKASKQSSAPPVSDADGDVAMDDLDKADDGEVKVDPVLQTINGMRNFAIFHLREFPCYVLTKPLSNRYQEQFCAS